MRNNPKYDDRYSALFENPAFKAIAHTSTGGFCCWCGNVPSTQLHHAIYGQQDILGEHLFPVCDWCHHKSNPIGVHSANYWIRDKKDPVMGNRNTPEAIGKLKENYRRLACQSRSSKSSPSWKP